jgi:4-amino-4-deoxy-L-arabinose transferase-like glycosyltransferase
MLMITHLIGRLCAVHQPLDALNSRLSPLLLILLCAALYLPGLSAIPVLDRDEARFVEATRQMVASGDLLRPRFQKDDRLNKPIGIYWLQSLSLAVFRPLDRTAIWPYRVPSTLAAMFAVLMTFRLGRILFDERAAWLAAIVLAASALLVVEAHQGTTDAALLACTTGALACLASIYIKAARGQPSSVGEAAGFWIWLGIGTLIKGPVLAAVSVLTIATLLFADRFAASENSSPYTARVFLLGLHPVVGLSTTLSIAAPWFFAITFIAGRGFFHEAVQVDLLRRFIGSYESHGAPPGYYLLSAAAAFWPASFVALPAVILVFRRRTRPAERFCLAWLIPAWIALEIIPTKLPHYVLPLYPALALIVASAADSPLAEWRLIMRQPAGIIGAVAWIAVALGLAAAAVAAPIALGSGLILISGVSAIAAVAAVAGLVFALRGRTPLALFISVVAGLVFYAPLLHWEIPALQALWMSQKAVGAIDRLPSGNQRQVAAVGYQEPSLVFLLDRPVALTNATSAVDLLARDQNAVVIINDRSVAFLTQVALGKGLDLRQAWSGEGLDYSNGKWMGLKLFERGDN